MVNSTVTQDRISDIKKKLADAEDKMSKLKAERVSLAQDPDILDKPDLQKRKSTIGDEIFNLKEQIELYLDVLMANEAKLPDEVEAERIAQGEQALKKAAAIVKKSHKASDDLVEAIKKVGEAFKGWNDLQIEFANVLREGGVKPGGYNETLNEIVLRAVEGSGVNRTFKTFEGTIEALDRALDVHMDRRLEMTVGEWQRNLPPVAAE